MERSFETDSNRIIENSCFKQQKEFPVSKKVYAAIAVAIVLVLALVIVFRRTNETSIGVVLPLSGSMAEYGENGRNGLTLASEEMSRDNSCGNIKLIYQDSGNTPPETVNAVRRLVDVDRVRYIIGGLTSSGVLAALPVAKERGVLFFTPAASAPGIPDGQLVFRNWPSDDALATMFGKAAFEKLGVKNVAILHVSNDYGKTNADAFSAAFKAAGGNVLMVHAFPQGTTDFKNLITQVRSLQNLDKLFIIAYPDEYKGLFQEIGIQKLNKGGVLASDTFYSPELLSQLGQLAEGTVVATAAKPGEDYEPRRRFIQAYKDRFKKEPGLVSDTAYDAYHIICRGIKETDGTPQAVAQWLHRLKDYQGAAGVLNFTETGDVKGDLALFQVVNGKFEARRF
jgi:branched-chain amino acid transport system substrate-binding protein